MGDSGITLVNLCLTPRCAATQHIEHVLADSVLRTRIVIYESNLHEFLLSLVCIRRHPYDYSDLTSVYMTPLPTMSYNVVGSGKPTALQASCAQVSLGARLWNGHV